MYFGQFTHSLTHSTTELGGPIFDPVSGDANGSMFILELESAAAVRAELEKDPYWTGNVVRVVVSPFSPCCSWLLLAPCSGIKKRSRSKRLNFPLAPRPPGRCQKPEFFDEVSFCGVVVVK